MDITPGPSVAAVEPCCVRKMGWRAGAAALLAIGVGLLVSAGAQAASLTGAVTFSVDPAQRGSNAVMSITLTNPNATAQTGVGFSSYVPYPTGLQNANLVLISDTCGGYSTVAPDYLDYYDGALAGLASCAITLNVFSDVTGDYLVEVPILSAENPTPTTISATMHNRLIKPTVDPIFSPSIIAENGTSVLTITISNRDLDDETATTEPIVGLGFVEAYPAFVFNATPAGATHNCAAGTVTATDGGTSLAVSGLEIPGDNGSCSISVTVTSNTHGQHSVPLLNNVQVTSDNAANETMIQRNLYVYFAPPEPVKAFTPTILPVGSTSVMSITLSNPSYNPAALTGVGFTDAYPANLFNTGSVITNTCGGTANAYNTGTEGHLDLTGGTVPLQGSCVITVGVTSSNTGQYNNTTSVISSTEAGPSASGASARVTFQLLPPTGTSAFMKSPIVTGETTTLTITLSNPNAVDITGAGFTSTYSSAAGFANSSSPAGATTCGGSPVVTAVAGGGSVKISGATIPASGSCTVTVQVVGKTSGTFYSHNSSGGFSITSTNAATGTGSRAQLDVTGPDFRIIKRVTSLSSPCTAGSCQVTYTLSLDIISGTGYGTSFTVRDVLPAQLTYVSCSTSTGTISNSAGTLTWTYSGAAYGIVPGAAAKTATITATVNTATQISNTATITILAPSTDPVLSNNTDTTTFQASAVSLLGLGVETRADGPVVAWETGVEAGTAGFYLFRKTDEPAGYVSVGARLIPGLIESPSGGTYRLGDPDAPRGVPLTYVLVEQQTNGERILYGPFTVKPQARAAFNSTVFTAEQAVQPAAEAQAEAGSILSAFFDEAGNLVPQESASGVRGRHSIAVAGNLERIPRGISEMRVERSETARAEADRVRPERKDVYLGAQGIGRTDGSFGKLGVRGEGLRFASSQQIGTGLGLSAESVDALIGQGRLALTFMQSPVAWLAGDHGVYFYGEGTDSLFTDDRVYLVAATAGTTMPSAKTIGGSDKATGAATVFDSVQHAEKDLVVNLGNPDAASDYWHWGYVLASNGAAASKTFELRTDGARNSGQASLKLKLYGGTDFPANPDHPVEVRLNGVLVGEASWDGFGWYDLDLSVSSGLLQDGANSVELTARLAPETSLNLVYLDSIDVRYPRGFVAASDRLLFTVPAPGKKAEPVVVSGFTTPDILVLNVSVPTVPIVVAGAQVTGGAGAYSVQFVPTGSGTQYLAVTKSAARAPDSIGAAQLGNALKSPGHRADYVVITASGLEGPAGSLASLRSKQGLEPLVVSVDEVMDTFNGGNYSPLAIRDFLAFATTSWAKGPRSVVLAGDASYDYRNNLGYGGNLVPTMMVGTPFGLAASDGSLAELDGDGVPDLAIGRLPVISASELQTVVDKLAAYDGSAGAGGRVVLSADSVSPTGVSNFSAESDSLALGLPSRLPPSRIYLDSLAVPAARTQLKADLAAGTGFLNFYGHSTPTKLAPGGLFTVQDVPSFAVGAQAPVVTAGTCFTNRFFDPTTDALGEVLAVQGGGYGAVGVFATSGYSLTYQATTLMEEFYRTVGAWRLRTLGEVTLQSLREFAKAGGAPFMTQTYGLLGDPATPLKNEKQ